MNSQNAVGKQGCIFWPFFPPEKGGGEIGTFWSLGKKIDPGQKKTFNCKKIQILQVNVFSITTATLIRNT